MAPSPHAKTKLGPALYYPPLRNVIMTRMRARQLAEIGHDSMTSMPEAATLVALTVISTVVPSAPPDSPSQTPPDAHSPPSADVPSPREPSPDSEASTIQYVTAEEVVEESPEEVVTMSFAKALRVIDEQREHTAVPERQVSFVRCVPFLQLGANVNDSLIRCPRKQLVVPARKP